ncbi:MAG: hypothetical protein NTU98_09515 [Bacteroidetes bacterium]|nr:hypothetical protein [Bacteroidota bacterium]
MNRKFYFFLPLVLLFCGQHSFSQVNVKDSSIFAPMFYATYAYQWPGGDLAKRYGSNSSIGGGFMFKTKTNWLIAAEGCYMFGENVKNSDSLLKNIVTPDGFVINSAGYYSEIAFAERGFTIFAKFGKVFPVISPNPNSGPLVMLGLGYLQNKIRIHDGDNLAPQVAGDYKKGYDRLNSGMALSGTIGYIYLGESRILNFSVNFEFIQAWTKSRRDYDFDTGKPDKTSYSSQFYGIRVKWIIPLYKRKPKDFYMY